MNKIVVITIATHEEGYIDSLRDSLHPIPLEVVGLGESWKDYSTKTRLLHNSLVDERKWPADTIFVVCDAFDVLYNNRRGIAELRREFLARNVNLLFSTYNFACETSLVKYFAKKMFCPFDYDCNTLISCNSGLFIGYRCAIIYILRKMLSVHDPDDERRLNSVIRENITTNHLEYDPMYEMLTCDLRTCTGTLKIGMDIGNRIFLNHVPRSNTSDFYNFLFSEYSPPVDTIEKSEAFFVHFIGNQNLNRICKYERLVCHEHDNKRIYTNAKKLWHYTGYFYFEILLLLSIIFLIVYFILNKNRKKE